MSQSLSKTPFQKIAMLTFTGVSVHELSHYDILFILKGAVRIQTSEGNYFLDEQDVFLLRPQESYTAFASNDNLVLSVVLDHDAIQQGLKGKNGDFIINSAVDDHRDYASLRKQLSKIASVYYGNTDINNLYLTALGYQLMYYIFSNHFENQSLFQGIVSTGKYSERLQEILQYLHEHYQEPISLTMLADHTHLSPSYLSKFFKKHLQTNFNQYLNQIRLQHAMNDLIHSGDSIQLISDRNGFPNINSFNKLFKEAYQTTPNKYRNHLLNEEEDFSSSADVVEKGYSEENIRLLESYADDETPEISNVHMPNQMEITESGKGQLYPLDFHASTMLNLAAADQMMNSQIEKCLARILSEFRFKYARFYHCLSDEFITQDADGHYDFFNLTLGIEIMHTYNVLPFFELSMNLRDITTADLNPNPGYFTADAQSEIQAISDMLRFCIDLYGASEVSAWTFEVSWYNYYPTNHMESPKSFAQRFASIYRLIKEYLPEAKVGGLAFPTPVPTSYLKELLDALALTGVAPDFISFSVFPYEFTGRWPDVKATEETIPKIFYTSDPHYALHKIQEYKNLLSSYDQFQCPIYISAINCAMHQSEVLNDSCFQSSFLVQSTIDLIGQVDLFGYFQMTDIAFRAGKTLKLANGKNGLMDDFGIFKPAVFSLSFFRHAGHHVLAQGTNYLLTKGVQGYCLILCNHIHVDEQFCMNPFVRLPLSETYSAFKAPRSLSIDFNLTDMEPGTYSIVSYHVNREHGSVLDAWRETHYWMHPDRNELEYLKHVVRQKRAVMKRTSNDTVLTFPIQMAPHEVAVYVIRLNESM